MHLCAGCHRHVREATCPFCGASSPRANPVAGPSAMRVGIARGALLVGLATAPAATLAACDSSTNNQTDARAEVVSVGDAYGLPADVVSMGEVYGIPADGGDVISMADAYGVPADVQPADAQEEPVSVGDAYGLPPDTGR